MKQFVTVGTTSKRVFIFIQDTTRTDGGGFTGLTSASGGLVCYRARDDDGSAGGTQLVLAAGTKGTWSSGGFVEKDSANLPGVYELGLDNAGLVTGSKSVVYMLKGATNMAPVLLELELVQQVGFGRNQGLNNFEFTMVSSSDHITAATGLSVSAQRSIDGGPFGGCANAFIEIGNGVYSINLAASDLNGTVVTLLFTATGADPRRLTIVTTPQY